MFISWKTTVCGVLAILGAITPFVVALLDGDPATTPSVDTLIASVSAALAGIGLVAAKDANK